MLFHEPSSFSGLVAAKDMEHFVVSWLHSEMLFQESQTNSMPIVATDRKFHFTHLQSFQHKPKPKGINTKKNPVHIQHICESQHATYMKRYQSVMSSFLLYLLFFYSFVKIVHLRPVLLRKKEIFYTWNM